MLLFNSRLLAHGFVVAAARAFAHYPARRGPECPPVPEIVTSSPRTGAGRRRERPSVASSTPFSAGSLPQGPDRRSATGSNQCVFDLERRAAEERTGIELRAAKEHDWKTTGPFACTGQESIGGR